MCGIAGQAVNRGYQPETMNVKRALDALVYRGPDGSGIANYNLASLGHRRLSIIDINHSTQPWYSIDKRFCLTFNGEIYNYIELRAELKQSGYQFRSDGDTEVLLALFIRHGANCLEKLNGMFSFAIWDNEQEQLFIGRDRVGKKPLFYAETKSGIAFSSEINALRYFSDINWNIDFDSVHDFFSYQFIPCPRTIYQGVKKLRPAHYLIFKDGKTSIKKYWSPPHPTVIQKSQSNMTEELRELIQHATKIRLRSDVPVGAFLSGGLDSSIIVKLMTDLGADVKSFTVGFDDTSFDERGYAKEFAQYCGTSHHEYVAYLEPEKIINRLTQHFGEPFADPSAIPMWHLCEYTGRQVKVALSGDGADELFGGYQRYRAAKLIERIRYIPRFFRGDLLNILVDRLPESDSYYATSLAKQLKLIVRMLDKFDYTPDDLLPQTFNLRERQNLFIPELIEARSKNHVEEFGLYNLDLQTKMMLTDIQTYLGEDILTKVDRTSMAHSLEVRSPLLDYRIIEYACQLSANLKIRHGTGKYILRQCYIPLLPTQVLKRRKHGFSVPLSKWFRNELSKFFEDSVLNTECPHFLNRAEILHIWNQHQAKKVDNGFKLWSLLIFFIWYKDRISQ